MTSGSTNTMTSVLSLLLLLLPHGVFGIATGDFSCTPTSSTTNGKYKGATMTPNNHVVMAPYNEHGIGAYDVDGKVLTTIGAVKFQSLKSSLCPSGKCFTGAVMHPTGVVFFAPYHFKRLISYDTTKAGQMVSSSISMHHYGSNRRRRRGRVDGRWKG